MFFPKTFVAFYSDLMIPTVGDYKSLSLIFLSFLFFGVVAGFPGFCWEGIFHVKNGGERNSRPHIITTTFLDILEALAQVSVEACCPDLPSGPRVQLSLMDFFYCLFWGEADGNTQSCLNLSLACCQYPPPPPFFLSCHLGTSL